MCYILPRYTILSPSDNQLVTEANMTKYQNNLCRCKKNERKEWLMKQVASDSFPPQAILSRKSSGEEKTEGRLR